MPQELLEHVGALYRAVGLFLMVYAFVEVKRH